MLHQRTINVFLVGPGLIGTALLEQIKNQREVLNGEGIEINVLGIADSKHMILDEKHFDLNEWRNILDNEGEECDLMEFVQEAEALQIELEEPFTDGVFVDCTASEKLTEFYEQVFSGELHIVTPNKKAASGPYRLYHDLKEVAGDNEVKFLYETNVGAGLPVISTLRDLVLTGDKVTKIEAILSGTLSYIFNTFVAGQKFSEVVKVAQEKGYTEPDPRDDLNGMDVARKILILAREAGYSLEMDDIELENLVPESAREVEGVDEFFVELEKADAEFTQKVEAAAAEGKVLRYIAKLDGDKVKVALEAVDSDHPFYNMAGSDNIVSFWTERYQETPLVVKGPGAGAEVTAAGVFADILKVAS